MKGGAGEEQGTSNHVAQVFRPACIWESGNGKWDKRDEMIFSDRVSFPISHISLPNIEIASSQAPRNDKTQKSCSRINIISLLILTVILFIFISVTGCTKEQKITEKQQHKPTPFKTVSPTQSLSIKTNSTIKIPNHWFKFRGNLRNTGTNENVNAPVKPVLKWKFRTKHEIMSSPAFSSGGDVFIGSHDGNVYKINTGGKGSILYHTGETITSSPLVIEDPTRIFWGNFNGNFFCIDDMGKLQFGFEAGDWIPSSPAISKEGKIFFACRDGFLYCLDMTGVLKWKFEIGKQEYEIQSSPAIFESSIIAGSATGFIYRIGFGGNLIWKYKTGGDIYASPAIDRDGNIFIGSWGGLFYCINKQGKLLWKYRVGSKITSSASLTVKRQVVFGAHDGNIYSFNKTGNILWKFNTGKSVESSPTSDKAGNIYTGSDIGKVFAISPQGKKIWEFETKKPVLSSPAIGENGDIVFGCEDKHVYCISDEE